MKVAAGFYSPWKMKYRVYIDGAARGNPGPGGLGVAIYGENQEEPILTYKDYIGIKTNNEAEYLALIRGLEELKALKARDAVVFSDSQLLIRQMIGEYRVKSENLICLYHRALELLDGFDRIEFKHIKRDRNKLADRLANNGIDDMVDDSG